MSCIKIAIMITQQSQQFQFIAKPAISVTAKLFWNYVTVINKTITYIVPNKNWNVYSENDATKVN